MVIENVLHFYKKGLNNWNLVFKFMKISLVYCFTLNLILLGSFIYCLLDKNFEFKIFALAFWAITLYSSMYFLISRPVKKVIKSKFGISINAKVYAPFSTSEWRIFRLAVLKTFLKENAINNKITIDELKRILTEKAENQAKNYTPLINTGIILALFVPVWSAANTRFFKSVNDFNTGFVIVIFTLFIIVLINMNIVKFKYFANEFSFYFQEQARINSLNNSLNIIAYEMLLSENDLSEQSDVFQDDIIKNVIQDYHEKYSNSSEKQLKVKRSEIKINAVREVVKKSKKWFRYITSKNSIEN